MSIESKVMEIVNRPSIQYLEGTLDQETLLNQIEEAGRTAYKSEKYISKDSAEKFFKMIRSKGHLSVLEFGHIAIKIDGIDRAIANELVRHRMASYCQESTRYCNYSKGKFGGKVRIAANPKFMESLSAFHSYLVSCENSIRTYMGLLEKGIKPEIARKVLPLSTATTISMDCSIREWYHILKLRTSKEAHPEMRDLMYDIYDTFITDYPIIFEGILD